MLYRRPILLPFKAVLHDDPGEVGVLLLLDGVAFQLFLGLFLGARDCQAGPQSVEVIFHRSVEAVESVVVLQHPMGQGTLFLVGIDWKEQTDSSIQSMVKIQRCSFLCVATQLLNLLQKFGPLQSSF